MTVEVHAVRKRREPGVGERGDRRRPAEVGGGRRIHRGRERRGRRHWRGRRRGREAIDDTFMLGGFEDSAQEDVLPPEGEEKGSVTLVDLASRLGQIVGGATEVARRAATFATAER